MATKLNTTVLCTISFLDTLCFGLIMPILPPYILTLGGNHKILGALGMLHMLLQLFSVPFARSCSENYGKKISLLITLFVGLLSNILIGIVTKYLSVIIIRLIFYLTNQTQTICKAFVAEYEVKERHNVIYFRMNLLGVLGFVIGPILGGYLFDIEKGFYYVCLITFLLSQISILLTLLLPHDEPKPVDKRSSNLAEKLVGSFKISYQSLRNVQLNKWTIIFMKISTTISLTAFFIKFALLLKVQYKANSTLTGYTVAYQSIVIFLSSFLVPFSDKIYDGQYIKKLLHSLSLLTISIANVCYAPTHITYLICFIPLAIGKCVFDSAWSNINIAMKTNNKPLENISAALDTVTTLTGVLTPIVFGYFCDIYINNAVKAFSIIPLAVTMVLLHFSTKEQFIISTKRN